MDFTLTLEMILELPEMILNTSEKYKDYSEPLRKKICNDYNLKELREKVDKKFHRFKDGKYLYKFPVESSIRITPVYQLREGTSSNTSVSKVEQIVTKQVDELLWIQKFYNALLIVANKLTTQEATYLVDSFFKNKSEEAIAYKLGICKMTLQNIKKSCLIKIWIEIETLDEDDK